MNDATEHVGVKPPVLVRYGKIADVCNEHNISDEDRATLTRLCEIAADRETNLIQFWHPLFCLTRSERDFTHAAHQLAEEMRRAGFTVRAMADGWLTILDLSEFCR